MTRGPGRDSDPRCAACGCRVQEWEERCIRCGPAPARVSSIPAAHSVVRPWLSALPFKQQSVLLIALRGCDGVPKDDPSKPLVRWYRRVVLNNADLPGSRAFGTFMLAGRPDFQAVQAFLGAPDHYPVHFLMHFLHAAEIVGYKHPDEAEAAFWIGVYRFGCEALHLTPESEGSLDKRLGYGTEG